MWVVDQQDDKIYAYDMATKARDTGKDFSTLPDADGFPDNIWSDRTTMAGRPVRAGQIIRLQPGDQGEGLGRTSTP